MALAAWRGRRRKMAVAVAFQEKKAGDEQEWARPCSGPWLTEEKV